ncbi:MAG: CO dehydrogenase/CO-methylating acetyl-CoA synthase complex subunit beta, partial [Candidatus Omnitrophota bacterium]
MSKIVAEAAIRGAQDIYNQAAGFLDKAIKEKGSGQKIGFPETAFYLPLAHALLGAKVETLKDAAPILAHAKSLLPQLPSERMW